MAGELREAIARDAATMRKASLSDLLPALEGRGFLQGFNDSPIHLGLYLSSG